MKRETIERRLRQTLRYHTTRDYPNRATIAFLVSPAPFDTLRSLADTFRGVETRPADGYRDTARIVLLAKVFGDADVRRHAKFLAAWAKGIRRRGGEVVLLGNPSTRSKYDLRSLWRGQRNGNLRAGRYGKTQGV